MNHFCTMFNKNYLLQGTALYESLEKHTKDFHLYVVAFDEVTSDFLKKRNYKYMTVVDLADFECQKLQDIKPSRSIGEYFWTCTPFLISYCIEKFKLKMCTYLDADVYFFGDPATMLSEMSHFSVGITKHNFTPKYDQSSSSGIYCVQFMPFKSDEYGLKVLNWWSERCYEWCYARHENGKFGDQKYLDDWTERFEKVHVFDNIGGGIAPWNVQQYNLKLFSNSLWVHSKLGSYPLIFYHFHALDFISPKRVHFGYYDLNETVKSNIYIPYIGHLLNIKKDLVTDIHESNRFDFYLREFKDILKRRPSSVSIKKF